MHGDGEDAERRHRGRRVPRGGRAKHRPHHPRIGQQPRQPARLVPQPRGGAARPRPGLGPARDRYEQFQVGVGEMARVLPAQQHLVHIHNAKPVLSPRPAPA